MFIRHESFKEYLHTFPVTFLLIVLNLIIFLYVHFNGGTTNVENLLASGALHEQFIQKGEYYRLISSMFLHIGFQHLIFNLFTLFVFCAELEKIAGKLKYIILYMGSGIGAGIAVYFFSGSHVTAGASGAIFGVFGAIFAVMTSKQYYFPEHSKKMFKLILIFNLIYTFIGPSISIAGHLGGLVTGFLLGYLLLKK